MKRSAPILESFLRVVQELDFTRPHAKLDNRAIAEAIDALIVARLEEFVKRPPTVAETLERIEVGR